MADRGYGADSLDFVLRSRRGELGVRIFAAGLMVVCSAAPVGLWVSLLWGGVYLLIQLLEVLLFWSPRPVFRSLSSRSSVLVFLTVLTANSFVFGGAGLINIYFGGGWGLAFASLIIAGGMLHTVITTTSAPRAFLASITPYIGCLALCVVMSARQGAPLSVLGSVGFGSALLAITAVKLWRKASQIQHQHRQANEALQEALAQAQVANRAKSAFLATMSHEIRTPLNGVLGMAQAMARDSLPPAQADRLEIIRCSGEALLTVLNDVLDLSKIEADSIQLEAIEFGLRELATGAYGAFTALAGGKNLSYRLEFAGEDEEVFVGDPNRLRQVLYNLISNAVKFTEAGEVTVRVGASGERVRFAVTDTGIGISEDQIGRLFQPFAQADTSITRRFGGTGLGLAVSRELVRKMGGSLEVESAPGTGSCFTFEVALPRGGDPASAAEAGSAPDPAAPMPEGLRVLAAEDTLVNQLVLRTLLNQAGVAPVFVSNGREAVEAFETEPWDLILMDVHMPEMDGLSALREIRRLEAARPQAPRTPVVMVTADVMSHHTSDYLEAGADGIVAKPLHAGTLFSELERVLAGERPAGEGERRVA